MKEFVLVFFFIMILVALLSWGYRIHLKIEQTRISCGRNLLYLASSQFASFLPAINKVIPNCCYQTFFSGLFYKIVLNIFLGSFAACKLEAFRSGLQLFLLTQLKLSFLNLSLQQMSVRNVNFLLPEDFERKIF